MERTDIVVIVVYLSIMVAYERWIGREFRQYWLASVLGTGLLIAGLLLLRSRRRASRAAATEVGAEHH